MAPTGPEGGLEGGGRRPPTGSFDSPRGYCKSQFNAGYAKEKYQKNLLGRG